MQSLNYLIRKAHFSPQKDAPVSQQLFLEFQFRQCKNFMPVSLLWLGSAAFYILSVIGGTCRSVDPPVYEKS